MRGGDLHHLVEDLRVFEVVEGQAFRVWEMSRRARELAASDPRAAQVKLCLLGVREGARGLMEAVEGALEALEGEA